MGPEVETKGTGKRRLNGPPAVMDAEKAVDWCLRKQQAHLAGKIGSVTGTLGHELIATGQMDGELRQFLIRFAIHRDAAVIYLAIGELTGAGRKLVRACGRAGTRPEWEGALYTPHTTTIYEAFETAVPGRTRVDYRERELPMGGPDAAAAARERYVAWWDALASLAGILSDMPLTNTKVIGPLCKREPWFDGYRFPGKDNRLLDGYERTAFIELAGKGMKPAELALKFKITLKQAQKLKENSARRQSALKSCN